MAARSVVIDVMAALGWSALDLPLKAFAQDVASTTTKSIPSAEYLASKRGLIFSKNCEDNVFASKATAGQLFELDAGDWATLLLGLARAGFLVVLA